MLELNQAIFYDTNPIPLKYMMRRLGLLPGNEHRLPMVPATTELEARLDGVLVQEMVPSGMKRMQSEAQPALFVESSTAQVPLKVPVEVPL